MSADPFANTTTVKNILQHVISPKIVSDGTGGYVTKTDLVNVHNLVFSERATGKGDAGIPLTAQCGTYTIGANEGENITFTHSRLSANSIVLAQVISDDSVVVRRTYTDLNSFTFTVALSGLAEGVRIGWFKKEGSTPTVLK
jgi:hypothetical protein